MPGLDCGIDIGTTNLKVVFSDEDGGVLSTLSVPTPHIHDGLGQATDVQALVGTLEKLIIDGWRQLKTPVPLRSITAAGTGEDGIGVDAGLRPTGPAIAWFDRRASNEANVLRAKHGNESIRAGVSIDPTLTAAKWLWLAGNRAHELKDAINWVTVTDFPAVWWSGRPFMSASLAPRTGCFDVYTRTWMNDLLLSAHAPRLPELLRAGGIVGGVRQGPLRESGAASGETVVAAGGHDHPVAASSIRRFDPAGRVDSLGTANLVYGETAADSGPREPGILSYSIPPSGSQGIACLGVLELSAFLSRVHNGFDDFRSYLSQHRLPGSPVRHLEELLGLRHAGGMEFRRALEFASLTARRQMREMDEAGVPAGRIYSTGGWSRSKAFLELRASVFGQPVTALGDMELTAAGAARFGAEAATGTSRSSLRPRNAVIVDPVPEWMEIYAELASKFDSREPMVQA
jgi:xylulokinase